MPPSCAVSPVSCCAVSPVCVQCCVDVFSFVWGSLCLQQTLIVRDPETGGACYLDSIWLSNDRSVILQRNGKHLLDVIGEISSRTNFQPKLDRRYQQVFRWNLTEDYMNCILLTFRLLPVRCTLHFPVMDVSPTMNCSVRSFFGGFVFRPCSVFACSSLL